MGDPEVAESPYKKAYSIPKESDARPYLALVDPDRLSNFGNIPRSVWEPMARFYNYAVERSEVVRGLELSPEHEHVRKRTLALWDEVMGWIEEILVKSQSVSALRSWQMVQALQQHHEEGRSPIAGVNPPGPQGQERRRGLGLRKR